MKFKYIIFFYFNNIILDLFFNFEKYINLDFDFLLNFWFC